MATLQTYDMKGLKLSFANWISNLSPTDTPFVSMTGKESVDQVKYQWQVDRLAKAKENAVAEGSVAADGSHTSTTELENYTQILRKAVRVTLSAKSTGLYGRSNELSYQMEKAGSELKRDLEYMFLNQIKGTLADKNSVRKTSGFRALVGTGEAVGGSTAGSYKFAGETPDPDTGAIVVAETAAANDLTEADLFKLTMNLYLAGAKTDTIMLHPKWMHVFFEMIASVDGRELMFKDLDSKFNMHINTIKDPLGQTFKIIPNRFMPESAVYIFNSKDWTQMVFRAPERTKLAQNGSSEKWMIEMEVGLRHRNPYASGILFVGPVKKSEIANANIDSYDEAKLDHLCLAFQVDWTVVDGASKVAKQKTALKALFTASAGLSESESAPVKATRAKKVTA